MSRYLVVAALIIVGTLAVGAQAPKKGYILGQIEVTNPQQYAEYTKLTPAVIEKFGGRFVARGGRSETLEGGAANGRVVVIEFPSIEAAIAAHDSPGYQAALKALGDGAERDLRIVPGLE